MSSDKFLQESNLNFDKYSLPTRLSPKVKNSLSPFSFSIQDDGGRRGGGLGGGRGGASGLRYCEVMTMPAGKT